MVSVTPIDVDAPLPDLGEDLNDSLVPFSAEWKAAVQERVDVFVVSLPLGTTPHDAEIEEKVAERLYDDEIAAAAVRSRLSEWCKAAKELQATTKKQQRDIRCLEAMAADAPSKQELQELRKALEAAKTEAAAASQLAASQVERQATEHEAAVQALLQEHEQKLQEADMRQLQTVIDADKRHQRALRQALSDQAATLEQQHAEALQRAREHVTADAAAATAEITLKLEAAERQAREAEQAVADAQQRAIEAEKAAEEAQRRAAAAEEAARCISAQDGGGSDTERQELSQQLADAQRRLLEAERAHADEAAGLRLQLEGTQDQLAETQQGLAAAEQRHAADAAELQSQLAAAQEQQQRRQQHGSANGLVDAGGGAVDGDAVTAAVQRRQQALGSEFEQALRRLEQQLQAQHDAEITALEQDFAGVAADMQARFDAAMQRERDSHSAQLQGLQGQLQTPARNDGSDTDNDDGPGCSPSTPLGWNDASGGRKKLLLEAPASAISEVTSAAPPQPTDDGAKAAASGSRAAAQAQVAGSNSSSVVAADAAAVRPTQDSLSATEARRPRAENVCGAAGCQAYLVHLQRQLEEQTAALASTQGEAQEREAELMEALGECQTMVDDLQQYSYDQGRDLAAAQTQLQALLADGDGTEAKQLLATAQETVGGLREQLAQARAKVEAAEAAAAEAASGQEAAASDAAAARGRASAAEAALETALATVKELCERQALASSSKEPKSAGISGKPVDALAAELAAEARRRSEAEAICEELTQYNTAVIEQAQEQNEALLAQLHARERTIRELMLQTGTSTDDIAAFMANINARVLDTAADYQPQPEAAVADLAARQAASPSSAPLLSPAASVVGSGTPGTGGRGGSATPAVRRPRPRSLSATPLHDAAVMQRLRFSASRDGLSSWAAAQHTPQHTPHQSPAPHVQKQQEQAGDPQAEQPSGREPVEGDGPVAQGNAAAPGDDSPESTSSVAKEARRLAASLRGDEQDAAAAADGPAEALGGPVAQCGAAARSTAAHNAQRDVENNGSGPYAGSPRGTKAARSPGKKASAVSPAKKRGSPGKGKGGARRRLAPLQALIGRTNLQ